MHIRIAFIRDREVLMDESPLLVLEHISKSFGGVHALTDVSLQVLRGEVHAVVGENGAGKSTMMKIISGAISPTSGVVTFEGQPVVFSGPRAAAEAGIAIVYQEPAYFGELSVLENIYLGAELRTPTGGMDWGRMTVGAAAGLAEHRTAGQPAGQAHARVVDRHAATGADRPQHSSQGQAADTGRAHRHPQH